MKATSKVWSVLLLLITNSSLLVAQPYSVAGVAFWYSPVLFVHGDDDRNVDFIQTTDLVQRLRKEGNAHVEILVFPDEVHGFLRQSSWIRTYESTADFFNRFLKN